MFLERRSLKFVVLCASVFVVGTGARATGITTLASFPGGESGWPSGALAYDGTNLYGTAQGVGSGGDGIVFKVPKGGGAPVVTRFLGSFDGYDPYGGVTLVGSRLFGVTFRGGVPFGSQEGDGTVFGLNTDGSDYQVLKTFQSQQGDSVHPHQTVTSNGTTLFGTTTGQALSDYGSVYRLNLDGTGFQTLHEFNAIDGSYPVTRLQLIGNKIYGATSGLSFQAPNKGTIFSMDLDGANFQTLHTFTGPDGMNAEGDLAIIGSTIYGVTTFGGASDAGTIFRVNVDGSDFETIHTFLGGQNGATPQGGLIYFHGRLWGTTVFGGTSNFGTIFSIGASGSRYTVRHSFNGSGGAYPVTMLLPIGSSLYGTAEQGGAADAGTLFAFQIPEPPTILTLALGLPFILRRIL
jgi:uncharacterized repeat protein (TIGR03803 family)